MKTIKSTLYVVPIGLLTLLSTSCGNDTSSASFTVGGMLSGLKGSGLVLQNNGGDDLALSADGTFTFSASVSSGSQYAVTVKSQPQNPTQTCTVAAGSGNVGTANVTGVQVNCSTNTYSVGGSVSGLVGGGLVLQNNAGDDLTIGNNGTFTFLTKIASGSTYDVQVKTQPGTPPQTCTVTSGTGTIATSDVTTVSVVCAPTLYKVGGTVTGLGANPVVLQNNLGDDLSVAANGAFQFAMGLQNGAAYAVSVKTRPAGQNCTVASGTGTIASANVTNVAVTCVNAPYYVLTGTPTHTTVFNTIAETYKFPNNLTNSVWNRQSNMILTGEFSSSGYWNFKQATNSYVASPNNDTTNTFTRLVQIPATNTVVFSKATAGNGVGAGTAANVMVATINTTTGVLSGKASAVFGDGFSGNCNLHSSSATEFLCLSAANTIKRYSTTAGSSTLQFLGNITLTQNLPAAAQCLPGSACYGSTFAFDGAYFYFATDEGSSSNLKYEVYDATGKFIAQDTATGAGSINGCYFDWSVGRYSTHDGYGGRAGTTVYSSSGGNSDSHNFGPIDTVAHTLP
jgi:hypothetical protein